MTPSLPVLFRKPVSESAPSQQRLRLCEAHGCDLLGKAKHAYLMQITVFGVMLGH